MNRHALRQKFLRLSWLPISPFEHINALMYSYICGITGFCDYTKFQKYLISPGYKKPANPFIRTKGLDKTTTLVLFIFFSQTSVVVSSYKNRLSCCIEERKVESLFYKQFYYLYSALKKICSKRLRRRF